MKWRNIKMKMYNKQHFDFSLYLSSRNAAANRIFPCGLVARRGLASKRSYIYKNTVELGRNLEGF